MAFYTIIIFKVSSFNRSLALDRQTPPHLAKVPSSVQNLVVMWRRSVPMGESWTARAVQLALAGILVLKRSVGTMRLVNLFPWIVR